MQIAQFLSRVRDSEGGGSPPAETFYLLLESGDRILLESGDKTIQEDAA